MHEFPIKGHTNAVKSLSFSPDGEMIVSGSFDKSIRVWCSKTGLPAEGSRPILGHEYGVTAVAFSPGWTSIASGSYDKTVRVWDAESGEMLVESPPVRSRNRTPPHAVHRYSGS